MIKLTRTADVNIIPASLAGARRLDKNRDLLEQQKQFLNGTIPKIIFKSNHWKAAKDATRADTFGKCAYCESATAVVAHGDIEHFRPKSKYWWLAYTYFNYCFCCQICNQSFKSDHFPIFGNEWPGPAVTVNTDIDDPLCAMLGPDPLTAAEGLAIARYIQLHADEGPGLPDPYFDDPESHFAWEADDTLREVKIKSKTNSALDTRRFKAVEDFFGLNRKELRTERYGFYNIFNGFKKLGASPNLSDADRTFVRSQLDALMVASAPYAAMCRFFDVNL